MFPFVTETPFPSRWWGSEACCVADDQAFEWWVIAGSLRASGHRVQSRAGEGPPCSVEIDIATTCAPWNGGRAGDRKVGAKGAKGWGWGGAGRISRKCCSAPLTAPLVLGNPHHKDLSEQCWSRYGPALPPVHFRSGLVLLTPIANSKVAVTPSCGWPREEAGVGPE